MAIDENGWEVLIRFRQWPLCDDDFDHVLGEKSDEDGGDVDENGSKDDVA